MKIQRPSNIFETREEAMAAVHAMKAEAKAKPAPGK
jgi:hypothetical protein